MMKITLFERVASAYDARNVLTLKSMFCPKAWKTRLSCSWMTVPMSDSRSERTPTKSASALHGKILQPDAFESLT